jgi:hypothetical protein
MRTVFVIGAGANTEIGMPSGEELKLKISKLLDFYWDREEMTKGDRYIESAIRQYCRNNNNFDYVKLCRAAGSITKAMSLTTSIDNFIDSHRGNKLIELCGKLAIVRSILNAEHDCALFEVYRKSIPKNRNNEKIVQLDKSWYLSFFKLITDGYHINELSARLNDFSFIIFNYDRCFEYFMYNALIIKYGINNEEAKNIVKNMNILHPYGIVGELWNERGEITFGETPNQDTFFSLAEKIKTFTENMKNDNEYNRNIDYFIKLGDRIIFLGFAYHKQNLSLLFNQNSLLNYENITKSENIICYGTGYGFSKNDMEQIRNSLMEANNKIVECTIEDVGCSQFFSDFWYTLSNKKEIR